MVTDNLNREIVSRDSLLVHPFQYEPPIRDYLRVDSAWKRVYVLLGMFCLESDQNKKFS